MFHSHALKNYTFGQRKKTHAQKNKAAYESLNPIGPTWVGPLGSPPICYVYSKYAYYLNPKPTPSKTTNLGLLSQLNTNTHTSPLGSQPQINNNNPLSSTPKTTLSHSISTKVKISSPTLPHLHNYKIPILWDLKEGVVDSLTHCFKNRENWFNPVRLTALKPVNNR